MVKNDLEKAVAEVLTALGVNDPKVIIEFSGDPAHGEYTTNAALMYKGSQNPKEFAGELKQKLEDKSLAFIEKIEVAGAGFINFFLKSEIFLKNLENITGNYGKNSVLAGKKIIIEYTDPNPFKEFHIGHLMPNTIGESLSRLIEFSGAETKRANYQGDVGIHVAKTIWSIIHSEMHTEGATLGEFGKAYAFGNDAYENNEKAKQEIIEINKKIYDRSDARINELYDEGRKVSLAYFETMYQKLGTKFDYYFFESEVADFGKKTVLEHTPGVFDESDGAIVYKGQKAGLHTRVFINSQGLPTYEAKELGLAKIKHEKFPYDLSVVVTGNEINAYFKVLLSAMKEIFSELFEKTKHISHGMLRLPTGKMSSRTGDIITAEAVLVQIAEKLSEKIPAEEGQLLNDVSVAAIKYSILKQEIGKDIIFDFDKSISFTGDSGPYLQYTHARCASLLEKGSTEGVFPQTGEGITETRLIERLLLQFPEVVERAVREHRPHYVATYLHTLASEFNSFYGNVAIVNKNDTHSPYKLFVTQAVKQTLANGLYLLGITAPAKM
jgi:arginyl-tRNA synthetase